jgi:hypothetical protein
MASTLARWALSASRSRNARPAEPGGDTSDARLRVYRLRPEPFGELRRWVEEVEAFWGAELAAFKAHVEGLGE